MSLLVHRPLPLRPSLSARAFSTSVARASSLHIEKNDPELVADTVPVYPYGPAQWYKQANKGLYGASRVQYGNNVSEKFKTKTRRTWHPNVVRKKLWSHALQRTVQIKVQARVLKTIDKVGGLDEYLLGEKEGRIKDLGMTGWWLRWAIMQTPHIKKRFAKERESLGLPKEGIESIVEEAETTVEGEAQVATKGRSNPIPITTRRSATFRQARLLKFRVGHGRHFVYTSEGWRRAQPSPLVRKRKAILLEKPDMQNYAAYKIKKLGVEAPEQIELVSSVTSGRSSEDGTPLKLQNTRTVMQQILNEMKVQLTADEEKAVRKAVGRQLRAQQEELLDKRVERTLAAPKKLRAKKKAVKVPKQQAWLSRHKKNTTDN